MSRTNQLIDTSATVAVAAASSATDDLESTVHATFQHLLIDTSKKLLISLYQKFTCEDLTGPDIIKHTVLCDLYREILKTEIPSEWVLTGSRPNHKITFDKVEKLLSKMADNLTESNPIFCRQIMGSIHTIIETFSTLNDQKWWWFWKEYRLDGVEQMFFAELAHWLGTVLPGLSVTDSNTLRTVRARIKYCQEVHKRALTDRGTAKANMLPPEQGLLRVTEELQEIESALAASCIHATFTDRMKDIGKLFSIMNGNMFDICHLISSTDDKASHGSYFYPKEYLKSESIHRTDTLMAKWITKTLTAARITTSSLSIIHQIDHAIIKQHLAEELNEIAQLTNTTAKDYFIKAGLPASAFMAKDISGRYAFSLENGKAHLTKIIDMHRAILKLLNVRHSLALARDVATAYGELWLYGDEEGKAIVDGLLLMIEDTSQLNLKVVEEFWQTFYGLDGLAKSSPGSYMTYVFDTKASKTSQTYQYFLLADKAYGKMSDQDTGLHKRVIEAVSLTRKQKENYEGDKAGVKEKKQSLIHHLHAYLKSMGDALEPANRHLLTKLKSMTRQDTKLAASSSSKQRLSPLTSTLFQARLSEDESSDDDSSVDETITDFLDTLPPIKPTNQ